MSFGNNIFGVCGKFDDSSDKIILSPETLITNLILFDSYVLVSCLLNEFPQIVKTFGFSETLDLLNSKALKINCDPSQIMIMGSTEEALKNNSAFKYPISVLKAHDHEEYLHACFQNLHRDIPLPDKRIVKLKHAILSNLDLGVRTTDLSSRPEFKAARSLISDLTYDPIRVKKSLVKKLQGKLNTPISTNDFTLAFHRLNDKHDDFAAETNIKDIFRLSEYEAHDFIQTAILDVGGIKQLFSYMSHYSAVSSVNYEDISILDDELKFVFDSFSSEKTTLQFQRVIEIKGFPDIGLLIKNNCVRLDKIIELRETREIKEFRYWLSTLDAASDDEIADQINSISSHIGSFIGSNSGKSIRVFITAALGLIGPGIGLAASAADSFVLEKSFRKSGPISFINDMLPSAFNLKGMPDRLKSNLGLEAESVIRPS